MDVDVFIGKWSQAPLSERAHCHSFIAQLCAVIGVDAPDEERPGDPDYAFERPVRFDHGDGGSHGGFIDCYRRGCFVLEAKQSDKRRAADDALNAPRRAGRPSFGSAVVVDGLMRRAKRQAESYARALDEWPPFLITVDVGRSLELWSDFARQGKVHVPFLVGLRRRITLEDLRDAEVRRILAAIWTDPMSLDPARVALAVTTDISTLLAGLVRSISARHGDDDPVHRNASATKTAAFVMQCIFAMFADSVGLIRKHGFREFLEDHRGEAHHFHKGAAVFFRLMDEGGYCSAIRQDLRRFNGGLFRAGVEVRINEEELDLLIEASRRDWSRVEPAIFGSLLEQALDPARRSELGAHFTPRAYVEELVQPTVLEPLRADWEAVEALALWDHARGDDAAARKRVQAFHRELCAIRVLDPACGTGNFVYVAMDMMKALEAEVLSVLAELGETRQSLDLGGSMVGPEQFWGMEKNRAAAGIAEMVMWIGHLQWHFRTQGRVQPSEPILRDFRTIRVMDALLVCDPDVSALDLTAVRPQQPPWPPAQFIVGNPPFMGGKDQRRELGDSYVDALWAVRQGRFRSADLVTAWWDRAAEILVQPGSRLRRFGFITTNSITQTFSRRVLEHHLGGPSPMKLVFAVPDHPWVRGATAAAVRVSMTVAERGEVDGQGRLLTVIGEDATAGDTPALIWRQQRGVIGADLSVGVQITAAAPLKANAGLASRGVQLMGAGFLVDEATARRLGPEDEALVREYRNGRDLTDRPRGLRAIDLFGWDETAVRRRLPGLYQHLLETVKPDRDRNNRAAYRNAWWIFGEPRRELREALVGLDRYIATVETAKHRWFRFLPARILPDNRLVCVASDDPFILGVLSSRAHRAWAAAAGGLLEDRPVYAKGACFDRFPFPAASAAQREDIGVLAEELDQLRGDVLARHPHLTMTGLYNARDRIGEAPPRTPEQRRTHEDGCVGTLHHLHMRLDALVSEAYGWPADLGDEALVARLVALNQDRTVEEAEGRIRFLRPDFQRGRMGLAGGRAEEREPRSPAAPVLPDADGPMASVVLDRLRRAGKPLQPKMLAAGFTTRSASGAQRRIERVLTVLAVAGSVHRTDTGWYAPDRPN